MTIVALILLAVLIPPVLFDLATRPTIRRIAVRSVMRRPGEAALVVCGALLATALITASFIIGDSFGSSIRNIAVDQYGPTDEIVAVADSTAIEPTRLEIEREADGLIDGTLGAVTISMSVASAPETGDRMAEPEVTVLEVDPLAAVSYTGDAEVLGADPGGLGLGSAVLNDRLAADLGVAAGDRIEVFVGPRPVPLTIAAVRPAAGLTGFGDIIVGEGVISNEFDDPSSVSRASVLVSNVGDVFAGAELTDEVTAKIEPLLGEGSELFTVKQDLLDDAEAESAEMTELFGTIGGFSVAAGILLVINLFVMLAGERKSELGTLRAVGLQRRHLVRSFALEGMIYGIAAAVVGTLLGIGVAAVVMAMAGNLFEGDLTIRLAVESSSLLSGAVIGLAVSQLTVVITAWRVTRLNIVRALRDLPEAASADRGRRALILGTVGVLAGIGLYLTLGDQPLVAMVAPVLALVSAVPLVSRFVPGRLAVAVACSLGLAWVAAIFGLLPTVMEDPEIYMFLVQGVLLVGLATVIVAVGDRVWLAIVGRVTGGGIASRLGLAEPLARPVRSALLVAMYALVIFTVTFMAVMNSVFQAQVPEFARNAGGGYELFVDTNRSSGVTAEELEANPDVVLAAPVYRGWVEGGEPGIDSQSELDGWRMTGIGDSFVAGSPPALLERDARFSTDDEAWAAAAAGEPIVLVDADFGLATGDAYLFFDTAGNPTEVTVGGTFEQGWLVGTWAIVGEDIARGLFGDGRGPTRFYVELADGADAGAVADILTADGIARGIDASSFVSAAKAETDAQQGFLYMLQGYLGLGLLIGIAGLGVVLVRAVRERRRQFGVMRALGIAAPVVRRAFVVEAAFVALQGVVLGIALGMLSAWQVLTRSTAFERGLEFSVPAPVLAVLGVGCLVASLAMAAIPAIRAGRTSPAVALRMTT